MGKFLGNAAMAVAMVAFFLFGIFQIYAGFVGINHELSRGWAIAALVVMFMFRSSLPITIGSFFCAWHVWHWHWALALLFASPTLLLVAPQLMSALYTAFKNWRASRAYGLS